MENNILLEQVSKLPDKPEDEVSDFADFLLSEISKNKEKKINLYWKWERHV